ncbi:MAG: delta-60 repeat domain-containing protein, partial [Nitrosomonadaceae bacterium]|nr:delta-60 repeat domain-containing protein [Nitrosomonadaceae bacterium]
MKSRSVERVGVAAFNLSSTTTLTINVAGGGSVVGSLNGVANSFSCAAPTCNRVLPTNAIVKLSGASTTLGFSGWSGECTGAGECRVVLDAPRAVTATFAPAVANLTVRVAGAGTGAVSSASPSFTTRTFSNLSPLSGASVQLTATADAGSVFSGWTGGGCSGTGTCTVSVTGRTEVVASFLPSLPQLLPSNQPSLTLRAGGTVNSVGVQPDGKVVIGGVFETISGQGRQHLARLLTNGALDGGFTIETNGEVRLVRVAAGFIYVFGSYTSIGGVSRSGLARISISSGAVDASWNPNLALNGVAPSYSLSDMAVDVSGNVYVLGALGAGGVASTQATVIQVLKLRADTGGVDPNWVMEPFPVGATPNWVAVQPTVGGAVYIGATLTTVAANQNIRVYKYDSFFGARDESWNPPLAAIDMRYLNSAVNAAGDVYIGGQFIGVNAPLLTGATSWAATRTLVKLSGASGAIPAAWTQLPAEQFLGQLGVVLDAAGDVYTLRGGLDNDRIVVTVNKYNGVTGAQLAASGLVSGGNQISFNGLATDGNGAVYVGGEISYIGAERVLGIARLVPSSLSVDPSFSASVLRPGYVSAMATQPDGKVIAGGSFVEANGNAVHNVLRLNTDGTLDNTFSLATGGVRGLVNGLGIVGGKVYVGGSFQWTADGSARQGVARFDLNGALEAWSPPTLNGTVRSFVGDSSNVFMMGGFAFVGGASRPCIAKFDASTAALDTSWSPAMTGSAIGLTCGRAIALHGGNVYVALGATTSGSLRFTVGANPRLAAKINAATGVIDAAWDPNPNGTTSSAALVGDTLYLVGAFTSIAGVSTRIAKFDLLSGAIDAGYANAFSTAQGTPFNVAVAGNQVYVSNLPQIDSDRRLFGWWTWRLLPNGNRDTSWATNFGDTRWAFGGAVAAIGSTGVIVGSGFSSVGGTPSRSLTGFSLQAAPPTNV